MEVLLLGVSLEDYRKVPRTGYITTLLVSRLVLRHRLNQLKNEFFETQEVGDIQG